MAYPIIFIGLLLIITGARDTYKALGSQLYSDFTGPGNFFYWLISIAIVGFIGYYNPWRTFSRLFLAAIILGFILKNEGIMTQLVNALGSRPVEPKKNEPPLPKAIPIKIEGGQQGGQGGLGGLGSLGRMFGGGGFGG